MKAIILAAGVGERMLPLTKDLHKCLVPIGNRRLIEHTLYSLSKCGISRAVIVVGHLADQIKGEIGYSKFGVEIKYVVNPYYDFHATSFSLSCAERELRNSETLIIEGDVFLDPKLFTVLINSNYQNATLVDTHSQIDPQCSVLIVGKNNRAEKVIFDPTHQNVFAFVEDRLSILGESVLVSKLSPEASNYLADELCSFQRNLGDNPDSTSYIRQLERVFQRFTTYCVDSRGLFWCNINSENDIQIANREAINHAKDWI